MKRPQKKVVQQAASRAKADLSGVKAKSKNQVPAAKKNT